MPLFIYLFYSWFCFVWGVLFACAEGIRRDELSIGLIRVIRWCFSLFELPTTVRMLPRQYLFQSWWNFRSHQTQLSIPASLCTESMVLHNIFQDFPHTHTVLLQQGIEQHAPCVPLKAGIGKRVLSSELRSTISQSCRWLCAGPWDQRPAGAQRELQDGSLRLYQFALCMLPSPPSLTFDALLWIILIIQLFQFS